MADQPLGPDLIWGVPAIAGHIGLREAQVYHLLSTGSLPAQKVGGKWVASRARLAERLTGAESRAA